MDLELNPTNGAIGYNFDYSELPFGKNRYNGTNKKCGNPKLFWIPTKFKVIMYLERFKYSFFKANYNL